MAADTCLHFVLGHTAAFDDDLVADHDRRGHRQIEGEVVVGLVFGFWFGSNFNGNRIFFSPTWEGFAVTGVAL